jgi:hypothetical protein
VQCRRHDHAHHVVPPADESSKRAKLPRLAAAVGATDDYNVPGWDNEVNGLEDA